MDDEREVIERIREILKQNQMVTTFKPDPSSRDEGARLWTMHVLPPEEEKANPRWYALHAFVTSKEYLDEIEEKAQSFGLQKNNNRRPFGWTMLGKAKTSVGGADKHYITSVRMGDIPDA